MTGSTNSKKPLLPKSLIGNPGPMKTWIPAEITQE